MIPEKYEKVINCLPEQLKTAFLSDQDHGIKHALETIRYALEISKEEKIKNTDAMEHACLFHDIATIPLSKMNETQLIHLRETHEEEGAKIAKETLVKAGKPAIADEVAGIIRTHDHDYGHHSSPAAQIVHDADKLDAIGEDALERTLNYHNTKTTRPFFNPAISLKERLAFDNRTNAQDTFTVLLAFAYGKKYSHHEKYYTLTAREKSKELRKNFAKKVLAYLKKTHPDEENEMLKTIEDFKKASG